MPPTILSHVAELAAGKEQFPAPILGLAAQQRMLCKQIEGAPNRVPVPRIASIESGEQVAVLWDTYGKDYWACYVRTSHGVRGWALCTSLKMVA